MLVKGIINVLCCLSVVSQQQFTLPVEPDSIQVEVDEEGRVFVAAGRQLLSLSRDLALQQNVSLSSDVLRMSQGSGGERLVVCTEDGSCAVYNSSHLSAGPSSVWQLVYENRNDTFALFTSENSFYFGHFAETEVRLAQYGGLQGYSNYVRSTNYAIGRQASWRFFDGFVSGGNAYYIISSSSLNNTVEVMRVCDNGCSGSAKCDFNALQVVAIKYGGSYNYLCGEQLMEVFAGTKGPSLIMTMRAPDFFGPSIVCLVPVAAIDTAMESKFTDCRDRPAMTTSELFGNGRINCTDLQVSHGNNNDINSFSQVILL